MIFLAPKHLIITILGQIIIDGDEIIPEKRVMRLLIKLRSLETTEYEMQYHYHLQGFIYGLLKGSKYNSLHNKEGYKFFCFSNIFPATKVIEKDDLRTLIISSPDIEFVSYLGKTLQQSQYGAEIKIGGMRFKIDYVDKLIPQISHSLPSTLITGTPIIIRIPSEKYRDYGVEPEEKYRYVYWRSDHPIDLFISQVENNLMKKYAEFHRLKSENGTNTEVYHRSSLHLFEGYISRS